MAQESGRGRRQDEMWSGSMKRPTVTTNAIRGCHGLQLGQ